MKLLNEMFSIERQDGDKVRISLNAGHTIYKAHFPGNPITPGVCLIQIIMELTEQRLQTHLELLKVTNLKFVAPISPEKTPLLDVLFTSVADEMAEVKVKGTLFAEEQPMTKFSLTFKKK